MSLRSVLVTGGSPVVVHLSLFLYWLALGVWGMLPFQRFRICRCVTVWPMSPCSPGHGRLLVITLGLSWHCCWGQLILRRLLARCVACTWSVLFVVTVVAFGSVPSCFSC